MQDLVEAHLEVHPVLVDHVRPLLERLRATVKALDAGEDTTGPPIPHRWW
jgi:hypothetical protein